MAVDMGVGRPVALGVPSDDGAVDDGDEVAVDKRHASVRLGGEQYPERVDVRRVVAFDPEVAEGDGEFLVRDASVRPGIRGDVECVDDLRFGKRRYGPEEGGQPAVVGTVADARRVRGVAATQEDGESVYGPAYTVSAGVVPSRRGEGFLREKRHRDDYTDLLSMAMGPVGACGLPIDAVARATDSSPLFAMSRRQRMT